MARFSALSRERLATCDDRLQQLFNEVVKHFDCTILEGYRPKEKQDAAFHAGTSKVQWPNSKHNKTPSQAVDVAPYPVDWTDLDRFRRFAWFVKGVASQMGIDIRMGADWDGDNEIKDQNFHDLPHFELVNHAGDY